MRRQLRETLVARTLKSQPTIHSHSCLAPTVAMANDGIVASTKALRLVTLSTPAIDYASEETVPSNKALLLMTLSTPAVDRRQLAHMLDTTALGAEQISPSTPSGN